MKQREKKLITIQSIMTMQCQWSVGPYVDRFLDGLAEGRITGVRCGKCGKVYVPPQMMCGDCFQKMEQWVELDGEGELVNWTVAHVDVRGFKLQDKKIIGMIRLKGAHTTLYGEVRGIEERALRPGLKVKAMFRDERKGSIRDISHYVALG